MLIKNKSELVKNPFYGLVIDLIEYALNVADPYKAIASNVKVEGNNIFVRGNLIELGEKVHVIGFGKASKRMAEAIVDILGDKVVGGVIISPSDEGIVGSVEIVKGDHPIPRENTFKSSQKLLKYIVDRGTKDDTVIVLISGGGSALFEVPEDDISLNDIAYISRELMKRGADIVELNTVRKRLSKLKGGKLLRYIKAKNVISIIVSDVIGDRLDTIASGPTSPDNTTFRDAYDVLIKYRLWDELPDNIRRIFVKGLAGEVLDTPKPGDPIFNTVRNVIVASNYIVVEELAKKVSELGFNPVILTSMLEGEAKEVGKVLSSIIKSVHIYGKPVPKPAAIIAGGETTVTVRGSGIGGRNQELCLSLAIGIKSLTDTIIACFATDGVDGVSPATGAIVDGETVNNAFKLGLDPQKYLDNNDSYTFFSKLGQAIITGYTGTNVNDIFIALIK
ncbi:MAG: glycerate kinase [Ignisphaera sp.]|uniref:Glycerate kinase n=1 Tax=Ignisphaera aggregans TaxID=334771 RepID=A0A7C4JKY7_9CREN